MSLQTTPSAASVAVTEPMDLKQIATDAVRLAMHQGATAAEVVAADGSEFSTTVRLGQVETLKESGAKAMGLRNLPSKTWQVNAGWVLAANIAADLAAWTRLLGCHDDPGLRDADPETLRYRIWHLPASASSPSAPQSVTRPQGA